MNLPEVTLTAQLAILGISTLLLAIMTLRLKGTRLKVARRFLTWGLFFQTPSVALARCSRWAVTHEDSGLAKFLFVDVPHFPVVIQVAAWMVWLGAIFFTLGLMAAGIRVAQAVHRTAELETLAASMRQRLAEAGVHEGDPTFPILPLEEALPVKKRKPGWLYPAVTAAVLLLAGTLTALWQGFNARALKEKQAELAALRARGVDLEQPVAAQPIPAAEDNFAASPFFQALASQPEAAGSRPDAFWKQTPGWKAPSQRRGAYNPATLKSYLPGVNTPEERWTAFEAKDAALLQSLREAMPRSEAVYPYPVNSADFMSVYNRPGKDLMAIRVFATWLSARAYVAMDAGRAEDALESLLILRRLSDVAASDELLVGKLVSGLADRTLTGPLSKGLDDGIWDETQLTRLSQALARRPDPGPGWQQTLLREERAPFLMLEEAKTGSRNSMGLIVRGFSSKALPFLPDGLCDLDQAFLCRQARSVLDALRSGSARDQWELRKKLKAQVADGKEGTFQTMMITVPSGLLNAYVKTCVYDRMTALACRLALYKARHGAWPATLAEAGEHGTLDPFTGSPYLYRVTDGRMVLYSAGPDGVDNGGDGAKTLKDEEKGRDWVW